MQTESKVTSSTTFVCMSAIETVVYVLELQKFGCHEVRNLSREVIPLTHSETRNRTEVYKT